MKVDTSFAMYSDTPKGKDPDKDSSTLRRYHKYLWSKSLPSGQELHLSDKQPGCYLYFNTGSVEMALASDSIIHTYSKWKRKSMADIIAQVNVHEIESFYNAGSTIGGYVLFPCKTGTGQSVNQKRGMTSAISDRFDLTLECIRLWYLQGFDFENPLADVLEKNRVFFELFESFKGYIQFFLLDDLVDESYSKVKFWIPFDGFGRRPAVPVNVPEYRAYRDNAMAFVSARNSRIERICSEKISM